MPHRIMSIDEKPEAILRFFQELGDDVVIVESEGKPLCVLYPATKLEYFPKGQLKDAMGAWDLPEDVVRAISRESPEARHGDILSLAPSIC